MVILVCGGRDYDNYEKVAKTLDEVVGWANDPGSVLVVNGGCRGADELSTRWAKERGVKFVEVPAQWEVHGKAAGPIRNAEMLDVYRPTQGVVFAGGKGTMDMLSRLFYAGVNTWVVGDQNA